MEKEPISNSESLNQSHTETVLADSTVRKKIQFKHIVVTAGDDRFNPARKRTRRDRVKVACFECQTRKVKCSGCRPVCKGCERSNAKCIYRLDNDHLEPPLNDARGQRSSRHEENNEEVESEVPTSVQVTVNRALRAPDSSISINEHFQSLSNWSLPASPHLSDSQGIFDLNSSDVFQAMIPALGSGTDSRYSAKIRVPYFRWFGPTGIVPGFTKVLVDLRQAGSEHSASPTSSPTESINSTAPHGQKDTQSYRISHKSIGDYPGSDLFDHDDEMVPRADILEDLILIFFKYFGSQFPFYQKDSIMASIRSKSAPAVLLNSMCALASRFSYHPAVRRDPTYMCGEAFGDKAKQLIVVILAVPSYDLVASLLMLSWYEFGCNRDVGFWMYTGMAIRMAQDLGMHKRNQDNATSGKATPVEIDLEANGENPRDALREEEEISMQLNLFWSIYFIDRIISLGTGRPVTLRDDQISCPLPADGSSNLDKSISPSPFPHLIRIMQVQGKATEEIATIRQAKNLTSSKRNELVALQDELIQIYTNIDTRLSFTVSNFRANVASGFGNSFLLLHIWFHAVIVTLHRPGLMLGEDVLTHLLGKDSLEVSMSSARTITNILSAAELIGESSITATPFINQAIYIAGLAFIAESEMHDQRLTMIAAEELSNSPQVSSGGTMSNGEVESAASFEIPSVAEDSNSPFPRPNSVPQPAFPLMFPQPSSQWSQNSQRSLQIQNAASSTLLQSASKRNYQICHQAISSLKTYWRGIGWILETMEQKAKGIALTDPSEESVDPASKIDLHDFGMLQRLLEVKSSRGRTSRGRKIQTATVGRYPVTFQGRAEPENNRNWEFEDRNMGWSSYGIPQTAFGIGDGWVDLTWLDPSESSNTAPGLASTRQVSGQQSGIWIFE